MLIEFRSSPIHGLGGFAVMPIRAGARIIQYIGQEIDKQESLRRCEVGNPFIFYLNSEFNLDGNVPENPARWLNHSCSPNAQAELIEGRIWIVAGRDIQSGEEVTFDYGYDLESFREYPCHCGSAQCVGYMVDRAYHEQLRAWLGQTNACSVCESGRPERATAGPS